MPLCFTKHLQISLTIRKAYSKDGHNVNLDEKKLSVPDPLPPPQVSFFFFLFSCCEVKGQVLLSAVIWCESLEMWKYIWLLSFAFFFFDHTPWKLALKRSQSKSCFSVIISTPSAATEISSNARERRKYFLI